MNESPRPSLFIASDAARVADDVIFAADDFSNDFRNSFLEQVIELLQSAKINKGD